MSDTTNLPAVVDHQADHAGIHNAERAQINYVTEQISTLGDLSGAAATALQAAEDAQAAAELATSIAEVDTTDDAVDLVLRLPAGKAAGTLSASIEEITYANRASRSSRDRAAGVGDSLSDDTWEDDLQALLDGVAVFDLGFSGEESSRIAFRQGGVTYTSAGSVTIPAGTTPVDVPVLASVTPHRIAGHGSNAVAPAVFAGVAGTVTSSALDGDGNEVPYGSQDAIAGTGTVRFVRTTAGSAVTAPAGSLMRGTDGDDHRADTAVFWTGQNDGAFAGELGPDLVVANTQAMIDHLSPDFADFIVLTVTTGSTLSLRPAFMAINAAQGQSGYASHLHDIRRHLIDNGLSILGITPTTADTAAIANDIIPPSLLLDGVHPTPACQAQVVAPFIRDALTTKGKAAAAQPEWQPLALTNGATTGALKASASNGVGYLRGVVLDGTLTEGTTLAVLPPACRPSEEVNVQISWRHQDYSWRSSNMTIYPGGAAVLGYGITTPLAFPIEISWPLW